MIAGLAGPRMATRRDRLVGALIFEMVLALQLLLGTSGFGRNSLFYSLVFLHALAALAGFGSIGFAGTYAAGAYLPDDRPREADLQPASGSAQPEGAAHTRPEGPPAALDDGTAQPEPGDLGQAGAAAGHAAGVRGAVEEVVVAEVIVETTPATTGEAVELDAEAEEMRRYFAHPARLWSCLILVPFLGAGALAAQPNGKGFDQPWVFGALAVWLAATLIAGSLVVPSLHQMQAVLLKSDDAGASPAARSSLAVRFARAGRIASRSAAFCDVLFLVALGLMIFRP